MRSLIIYCVLFMGASACNYREVSDQGTQGTVSIPSEITLNFLTISEKILAPHCLSCHSNAGGNIGQVNLETYSEALQNIAQLRQTVVDDRRMPPSGPLNSELTQLLKQWIESGAPE